MNIEALFGEPLMATSSDAILYMLSTQVNSEAPGADAPSEFANGLTIAQEMEALRIDLAQLENGWMPSAADLVAAPELQEWGILDTGDPLPKIVGYVVGASAVGSVVTEGKRMITLHILARDKDLTWVRDRRGFYRLDEEPTGAR